MQKLFGGGRQRARKVRAANVARRVIVEPINFSARNVERESLHGSVAVSGGNVFDVGAVEIGAFDLFGKISCPIQFIAAGIERHRRRQIAKPGEDGDDICPIGVHAFDGVVFGKVQMLTLNVHHHAAV